MFTADIVREVFSCDIGSAVITFDTRTNVIFKFEV